MTTTATADSVTYWVGGSPASLVLAVDSDAVDLAEVSTTTAALVSPEGVDVPGITAVLDAVAEVPTITVDFPDNPFMVAGLYSLRLTLTAPTFTEVVEPVTLVVQAHDGWLTLQGARDMWTQAPASDVTLAMLLESAKAACVAFAPTMDPVVPIPANYRQAQFQQARSLWLAMSATTDSQVGEEGFSVTVYPLDWNVKQLLRPRGIPVMW